MTFPTRRAVSAAILCAPFMARSALAQANAAAAYPNRPIKLIVPSSPGGGTDLAARWFAPALAEALKQPVVVDNRAGASGLVGMQALAGAQPDGYTLGFLTVSQLLAGVLSGKFTFDGKKDFEPIVQVANVPLLLVVSADSPIRSLADLVAAAKARPGALNYGSGGSGGITHFAVEMVLKSAGIQVAHVPYKGSSPVLVDLLSGRLQVAAFSPETVASQLQAGKLRALAVVSDQPSPLAPGVPTLAQAGVAGSHPATWYGLFAPLNTPAPIVNRVAEALAAITGEPANRDRMVKLGMEPVRTSQAQFRRLLQNDQKSWVDVADRIGFKFGE